MGVMELIIITELIIRSTMLVYKECTGDPINDEKAEPQPEEPYILHRAVNTTID